MQGPAARYVITRVGVELLLVLGLVLVWGWLVVPELSSLRSPASTARSFKAGRLALSRAVGVRGSGSRGGRQLLLPAPSTGGPMLRRRRRFVLILALMGSFFLSLALFGMGWAWLLFSLVLLGTLAYLAAIGRVEARNTRRGRREVFFVGAGLVRSEGGGPVESVRAWKGRPIPRGVRASRC